MLPYENVEKLYKLEIERYQRLLKEGASNAESTEQKRHAEMLGKILELSPEQIMYDLNS